jgi:Transposase DDE domain
MKQREANKLLCGFKQAFSERVITELGRKTGFFKRARKMTPMKMVMSLMSCFAGGQSTTLADVQRSYNALSPEPMAYKPFHNQLSKAGFARFMRELAAHVLSELVVEVLKPGRAGLLAEFGRVVIQDGSSFAVHHALRHTYPGRFTTVSPAAVELHVSWDLCRECIEHVTLTPDTFTERAELPSAENLSGDLLLADRGYFDREYLREVAEHGGRFLVRTQKGINPVIDAVHGGARAPRLCSVILSKTFSAPLVKSNRMT